VRSGEGSLGQFSSPSAPQLDYVPIRPGGSAEVLWKHRNRVLPRRHVAVEFPGVLFGVGGSRG
jgi:hypothetical protein